MCRFCDFEKEFKQMAFDNKPILKKHNIPLGILSKMDLDVYLAYEEGKSSLQVVLYTPDGETHSFNGVPIKFCPRCGKRLPNEE
jgi:hypothetical protein